MKDTTRRFGRGFTLIELLVVLGIIAILAALLLPAASRMPDTARKRMAQKEIGQIVVAFHEYEADYSHLPISSAATGAAGARKEDFTFGGLLRTPTGSFDVSVPGLSYQANNSEIMAVLLDRTNYPSTGLPTINAGSVRNTQHKRFLEIGTVNETNSPGIGPDLVCRDPWGTPYIITSDLNNDQKACDGFYRRQKVSQMQTGQPTGYFGLFNSRDPNGNGDHYEGNTGVMVWSAGPDKLIDPERAANEGGNKDNVLSWKQ